MIEFTYQEAARFMRKVDRSGDCWIWTGAKSWDYGYARVGGKNRRAHRAAYELFVGPIPEGLQLDHLCRQHACVNPAHLEAVTGFENMQRSRPYRMRTHCKRGHVLAGNRLPDNGCRLCANAARNERKSWRKPQ